MNNNNTTTEKAFKSELAAKSARRELINEGRAVSLIALDPGRDLYVFDLIDA